MRTLAQRKMTDRVDLQTVTKTAATRLTMADGAHTLGTAVRSWATVRQQSAADVPTVTADRTVRDLDVWVPLSTTVTAGMRCTIVSCDDPTLTGDSGAVVTVERDTVRAVRRCVVRMSNDA